MNNYNNLSKEELIALLNKADETIASKDETIANKDKKIDSQNKTIDKLNITISIKEVEIRNLHIKVEELIAKYEDKVSILRGKQIEPFIPKSEKLKDEDLIIDELEVIKEKRIRKSPSENFLSVLKNTFDEEIIIDYDFKGNGVSKDSVKPLGKDETFKIEYNPASYKVIKYIRPKYKDKDKIYESLVDDPFPHSPLTPSLAANLLEMKFNLGVPFYRYSNYLKANGLNISDSDIANYAKRSMDLLEPLYNRLLNDLVNNKTKVIHSDETPLKVINSNSSKCYMFVYTTSFWDNPIYIYNFNESRSTDKTKGLLKDYKGYLICDGYSGYDSLSKIDIKIQRCMVHARRYFNDCVKPLSNSNSKKHPSYKVLLLMNKIFKKEKYFKDENYTPNQIKEARNSNEYLELIANLNDYIESINTNNDETLRKAVNYYLNNKKELYTYLENGYLDISNNLAERVVKPFVISRKNFLFCKTVDGATTTAKLFSIVQTARANGLKSEKYLAYLLTNINKKPIEDLLPWTNSLPIDLRITKKDI